MPYFILAMYRIKRLWIAIWLMTGSFFSSGQGMASFLQQKLEELGSPDTRIAFQLMDLESGVVLFRWNDTLSLIPASIQKCITAFSTLHFLGEDFVYKTPISYTGEILRDGNLTGHIVIEGSGDPSMGSTKHFGIKDPTEFFDTIAKRISRAGINCIDGDLIVDVSAYGRASVPRSWIWEDLGNYYGAGVYGVNFNENYYDLYLNRANAVGIHVNIDHTDPPIPGLFHHSYVKTAERGSGDQAFIFGAPYSYERYVEGTIPMGVGLFKIQGSMPDPPKYFGEQLALALQRENIQFRSLHIQYDPKPYTNKKKIYSLQSPRMEELVKRMLEDSHNMYSEAFVKKIGEGSHEVGMQKIMDYMFTTGDFDSQKSRLVDGSGLSVLNRINPDQMNSFLWAQSRVYGIKKIRKTLPEAGKEGTVRNMLKEGPAKGHVWIKSGSMDRVLCYHGIINTAFRQNYAFTIMINGDIASKTSTKQRIESLLTLIYKNQL